MVSPTFQPPPAPNLPEPSVSPALIKGTGTQSITTRLGFWRALAVRGLLLWAVPYVTVKVLSGGCPPTCSGGRAASPWCWPWG